VAVFSEHQSHASKPESFLWMGSICYSSETEFLVIYLMIPCWTFLFVVGWDSFSIPDKKAVFDLFAPFGEMEFLRVEKTYGRF